MVMSDVQAKQVKSSLLHPTQTTSSAVSVRSAFPKASVSSEKDAGIYNIPDLKSCAPRTAVTSSAATDLLFSHFQEHFQEDAYSHRKKKKSVRFNLAVE